MLKKSLIAIAILAIAIPSFAGTDPQDNKVHGNWPCVYVPQAINAKPILVKLDVGFYIWLSNTKPFWVTQESYKVYSGCYNSQIESNFPAIISAKVKSAGSAAGGSWSVTSVSVGAENQTVLHPNTKEDLTVCVKGTKVNIQNLTGGTKGVVVAELTILAVPAADCASCGD